MKRFWRILIAACGLMVVSTTAHAQERFRLHGERTSGDMERALNEAGAAGYRFAGSQGGSRRSGGPTRRSW